MKQSDAESDILMEWLNLSEEDKYDQHCGLTLYGWLGKINLDF